MLVKQHFGRRYSPDVVITTQNEANATEKFPAEFYFDTEITNRGFSERVGASQGLRVRGERGKLGNFLVQVAAEFFNIPVSKEVRGAPTAATEKKQSARTTPTAARPKDRLDISHLRNFIETK